MIILSRYFHYFFLNVISDRGVSLNTTGPNSNIEHFIQKKDERREFATGDKHIRTVLKISSINKSFKIVLLSKSNPLTLRGGRGKGVGGVWSFWKWGKKFQFDIKNATTKGIIILGII